MTILDIVLLLALAVSWLAAALILWRQHHKATAINTEQTRLAAQLASVPGGCVSWFNGDEEPMSPGLAALIGIDAASGPAAGYAGLCDLFPRDDRQDLDAKVEALRRRGEEFSITLLTQDAGRALQLNGRRGKSAPLDVLWVSDVTNETAVQSDTSLQLTAVEVERDGLRAMLDAIPLPVWRRGKNLALAHANRAYIEAVQVEDQAEGSAGTLEEIDSGPEMRLAEAAQSSGTAQSQARHAVIDG